MPSAVLRTLPLALAACALIVSGCSKRADKDYDRPLAPGSVALVELDPSQFPRFTVEGMERQAFLDGIEQSLSYLEAPSSHKRYPVAGISHEDVVAGLVAFRDLLNSGAGDAAIDVAIRSKFRVFRSVGWDGSGEVLFTGYYTPIFDARLRPDSRFRYPIYRRPKDLVSGPTGKIIAQQRRPDGSLRPYPTAAELRKSKALEGLELAWLENPFDAYTVVVQGSARLRLANGKLLEIGYNGTNGHPYHSVGRDLVAEERIPADQLNLTTIRSFFVENPRLVNEYIDRNPRTVFFTESSGGPYGSIGRRVTPDVSIATDKAIFPAGALTYVVTSSPDAAGSLAPYYAFRLDQDTGGAISAPGRADLYMGEGKKAERRAGHQLAEGYLYYLITK
jgi:membrane-bound lytic murein transglycosylase A